MNRMLYLIIAIVLIYLLIVRPLTRNRWNPFRSQNPPFGPGGYGPYPGYGPEYGPGYAPYPGYGPGTGSGLGAMAGGFAAGALLTYLLEQNRIDAMQYNYLSGLEQDQLYQELLQQNILQQHEIDQLMAQQPMNPGYDPGYDPGWAGDPYSASPDSGMSDAGGGFGHDGEWDGSGGDWV
jgi:hypothetical protein